MSEARSGGRRRTVAVVGGGIAGLSVAFELLERSQRLPNEIGVLCLEAADRPGGNLQTLLRDGFLCESGATGFLDNAPATLTLVRRLGLTERVVRAEPRAGRRFVFRGGRLRQVPTAPAAFLRSGILPLHAKLRVMAEPLIPARRDERDESIFDFAARRIGRRAAGLLVDAMVAGIYAGDVKALSLRATFPRMREMEAEHGSLFRAMRARRKQGGGGPAGPGGRLTSFKTGMQELVAALGSRLGVALHLGTKVTGVSDLGRRGFRINRGEGPPLDVDAVVLACPAWSAADLVQEMDHGMAQAMSGIPSAALAVVHLGYREAELVEAPLDGFGFLVPRGQNLRILGTLWCSSIFPGRAPEGRVLLTTMVGGAHDPEAFALDDAELIRIVRRDLEQAMGISAEPLFSEIVRHRRGIPQYTLGHLERVSAVELRGERHPGLFVCGNSYRGISINACVEESSRVAEAVLADLSER